MATGRLPDPNSAPVTAKGDLYTYSTVPAKLAVGSNGETLVADSSTSTGLRYNPPATSLANPVINGAFDIWQRGTSLSGATNNTYTADRWSAGGGGNATTVSRQATGDTTNLPNIQYCARVQRDSGNTSTYARILTQALETTNSIPFAGKAVTLSFYARKGANFSAASDAFTARVVTGTGTDQNTWSGYTNQANTIAGTATLTTTWQRFVITGTIPSNCTEFTIYFDYTPVGTAGAADYYEVTGVQLDLGTWTASTAPAFRRSGGTLAGELAACKRYYAKYTFASGKIVCNLQAYLTSAAFGKLFDFQVEMRTNPSVTMTGIGNLKPNNSSGSLATTTAFTGGTTDFNATQYTLSTGGFTGSSGLTAGNNTVIQASGGDVVFEVSSEL